MKRLICLLLALCLVFSLCACGGSRFRYGINTVQVLVQQEYSLAFRNNDPLYFYVTAALSVLAAEGRVDQLATKWLGSPALNYAKQADALEKLVPPEPQDLIIGLDVNAFPFSYLSNGEYWGLDVELALAVCEKLGWTLKMQPIEKENVYVELSSGNIDVAWGGIALDPKEAAAGNRMEQDAPERPQDVHALHAGGSRRPGHGPAPHQAPRPDHEAGRRHDRVL